MTYISGYTVIPAFPGLPDTVVTQYDWKYEVKCNEEVLSAVLVDAPLEDEGLGTLSTPDGVPPGNLYKVQQVYSAYAQFRCMVRSRLGSPLGRYLGPRLSPKGAPCG